MTYRTNRQAMQPPTRLNRGMVRALQYGAVILLCTLTMIPVLTAVLGGTRTTGEFLSRPLGLPENGIRWENYTEILLSPDFWNSLKNSAIITAGVTILNLVLGACLAMALARISFRGRGLVFNILTIGLLFPLVVAILPIFIQLRQLSLINSMWGIILPLTAFGLPVSVLILRNFFRNVPRELEDAAYIDGCTVFDFMRLILLPISRPALASVATLQVILSWNEYFLPLIVLNDPGLWPLPLGIMQYQGQYGTDWSRVMAYVTLLVIPAVLFYLVAGKYIVAGLSGSEIDK